MFLYFDHWKSFGSATREATREYSQQTKETIALRNVAIVLNQIFSKSINSNSIKNGFQTTGLYPFNVDAVELQFCIYKPILFF